MNFHRWAHEHSLKLLAIRDTPQAIAGGIAIGIFFGFTPLWGLKTLLSILFAWLTGSNIVAAVLAGTMHDIIFPFMPVIYRVEYDVGYWLLSQPHRMPAPMAGIRWQPHQFHDWTTHFDWTRFFTVGKPLLVGSSILGAPVAIASYFIAHGIVTRHQRKKAELGPPPSGGPATNPS
jgi:uncharacterized protein (DUF2062 family)